MSLRVKLHVLIIVTLLFGLFVPYGVREAAAAPAPLVYDFAQMGLKKKDNTVQPTGSNNHNLALIGDQTSVLPKVYGGNYGVSIESSLTQTTRSFSFDVPVGGLYAITLKAALSTDGGIADIYLDQYGNPGGGTKLFAGFEFYKNATDSVFRTLNGASSVLLAAGTHTITFTVIARKLSSGPAYMFPYVLTLTEQPITASPANATFNKDAPADINVAMSVYQSLVSIQNGAQLLVPGTDYIAGDYQVTLKKEYLSTLETGAVPLTFDVVYGTQPQVTVNVTDPAPETLFLDLAQLSLTDPGTGWYLTKLNPGTYPRIALKPYGIELGTGPSVPIRSVTFQVYNAGIYDIEFVGSLFSGGTADIYLDTDAYDFGGTKVIADFSFYKSDTTARRTVKAFNPIYLSAGSHKFTFVYTGKNPNSTSTYLYPTSFTLTRLANTVDPIAASFDRAAPADMNIATTVYSGASLSRIVQGMTALQSGTDYAIDGEGTVSVKKAYLLAQPLGQTVLTFDYTRKNDPAVYVSIIDSTPVLAPSHFTFDRNPAAQADIAVTMATYGHAFGRIANGTTDLLRDRDYAVTPTAIILKKAYLAGLAVGSTTLTVDFPGLIGQSLLVNVTDTSSTVAPSRVGFSRRNAAQQDITVTLQAYGDAQLLGIYNGEVQLQHNVDYALSGHTVTLKKAYLSTLQGKAVALTFRMSSGNDPNVTIYPVSDEPTDAVLSSLATGVSGMDVKLSGTISTGANRRVTEIVSDPNGVPVYIGQSVSGTGGSFELTFTASRLLTGTYTVKVGGEQVSDPQTITFAY